MPSYCYHIFHIFVPTLARSSLVWRRRFVPRYHVVNLDKLDECSSLHNLRAVAGAPNYRFIRGDILSEDLGAQSCAALTLCCRCARRASLTVHTHRWCSLAQ